MQGPSTPYLVPIWEYCTLIRVGNILDCSMRIISKRTLREFWERFRDAEEPLLAWYREVEKEDWGSPVKVKEKYRSANIIKGSRVVFNIKGNDYRLVVKVNYQYSVVHVRFVGTQAEYDEVDVEEV